MKVLQTWSGYELFVSWRYLRSKRKDVFISLISTISIGGVALGVMALIIVLAVMTGLTGELRDKILGTHSHILIFKRGGQIESYREMLEQTAATDQVVGVAPFIIRQVMIQSDRNSLEATLKGVDPQGAQTTSELGSHILGEGTLDFLDAADGLDGPAGRGILLGSQMAEKLHVSVGDSVSLISPMQDAESQWPIPKLEMFQVSGIFEYGMYEYDSNLMYISLPAAQEYFETGDVATGIEVKVKNIFRAKEVARKLKQRFGLSYSIRDWSEMNKNLFAIFALYKKAMFLLLTLIVLVACLNIASTLIMMVMEKSHDIAVLKSMGASSSSIMKIFVMQGLFIGFTGTGIGCLFGVLVCRIADTYKLIHLEGGVYYLNYLPFRIMPLDFSLVAFCSVLICFLSTLYPAKQAALLDPAVALRYE